MIQQELIEKFNKAFEKTNGIQSAIIIGSFGRGMPKPNSDIDYQVLVNDNFNNQLFFNQIKSEYGNELKHSLFLENKNKWCFYLTDNYIITEVFICSDLRELDKYYLGSEISNPEKAVVFDKTNSVFQYFQKITKEKEDRFSQTQKETVKYLITEFQNRFEACSNAHAKSDGYKFNVLFSHGLNAVVRLIYLCSGASEYDYMPPNFLTDYSYKHNLEIENLGTMDLRHANWHKRKLFDLFLKYLDTAIKRFEVDFNKDEIAYFLENIYKRDFFWNFRDISKFNSKVRSGLIYRSSAFCLIKEEDKLLEMLYKHNIKTIIDLRADREIAENSYSKNLQSKINIVHAPFDPWNQSIEFQNTYNTGTNIEIAYKFFAIECKPIIKKVVETILNSQNAVSIHCHAGKDRTGIVITLFHLLSGANEKEIFFDYLASEMDTKKDYLNIVLKIVNEAGGIVPYLIDCGLENTQIEQLKHKLLNGK
jgi:protein tyrosine/serine phosphatase/predicted nucleotidyltransferase